MGQIGSTQPVAIPCLGRASERKIRLAGQLLGPAWALRGTPDDPVIIGRGPEGVVTQNM